MQNERGANQARKPRHGFQPLLFAPSAHREMAALDEGACGGAGRGAPVSTPSCRSDDAVRRSHDSHVRLRVVGSVAPAAAGLRVVGSVAPSAAGRGVVGRVEWLEAQALLDELSEDQRTLSMNLASLEPATSDRPRDSATIAALRSLDARLDELGTMRDVLAALQQTAAPRSLQKAFLPDAPLADYLRGVYAWLFAVVRALEQLVVGLRKMQPDWALYRWQIEEAKNFHFDELEDAIIEHLAKLFAELGDPDAVIELTASFEVLLTCARELEVRLDKRFG